MARLQARETEGAFQPPFDQLLGNAGWAAAACTAAWAITEQDPVLGALVVVAAALGSRPALRWVGRLRSRSTRGMQEPTDEELLAAWRRLAELERRSPEAVRRWLDSS